MSATNFESNGLMDSLLPNIYINKITLEQLNSRPLSNNKYDMTPHINQTLLPDIIVGRAHEGVTRPMPSLTAESGGFENVLKVTLDMFLEIPNIDDSDFWDMVLGEDMFSLLSITTRFYSGKDAKNQYIRTLEAGPDIFFPATKEITTSVGEALSTMQGDKHGRKPWAAIEASKAQYKEFLPDGTSVFKIPIQVTAQMTNGTAFPTDLAVLAQCTLDLSQTENLPDILQSPMSGRLASEIIIQDKKTQDKGMIFFISNKQDDKTFDQLKGQIWLGSVHKFGDRYMVGSTHSDDPHPFLDYIIIPTKRIQDFRQVSVLQKQSINFTPTTDLIFGGDYTDLRATKNSAAKSLDNAAIFSDLISSTTQDGKIKLFFNIDWGRMIKKYCAVPALIDKLALDGGGKLQKFFTSTANGGLGSPGGALSFRIYREEIGAPVSVINDNRSLIYDSFPHVFYYKDSEDELPTSSLIPIPLYTDTAYTGFVKSYSFTDYRKDTKRKDNLQKPTHDVGKFKYSVEIVVHDPTIPYLVQQLKIAQKGTDTLKKMMVLTNGQGSEGYWNKYLGKFNDKFKEKLEEVLPELGLHAHATPVWKAVEVFKFMTSLMRSNYTSSAAEISTADSERPTNLDFKTALEPMLDPDTASPSSIATAYDIFTTLTSQLRNVIESFSSATLPKTSKGADENGDLVLQQFTKTPTGASLPQRKIKVEHTFDTTAEIVDTTKMDAGHDIFAKYAGHSKMDIGLKLIHAQEYIEASMNDHSQFFLDGFPDSTTVFFDLERPITVVGSTTPGFTVPVGVKKSIGRFLTVPQDLPLKGKEADSPRHTRLPDTIMSIDDDEFSYWKLANNIIRYKFGLFGNPDETSFLGYENIQAAVKAGDVGKINDKMERIIKEYQSLASHGAVFSHQTPLPLRTNQPSAGNRTETETEESPEVVTNALPWTEDIGQERFLLSLIMQDYFDLSDNDKKLKTFNTNNRSSPIGKYFNKLANLSPTAQGVSSYIRKGALTAKGEAAIPGIDALPNQVKALIFNNVDAGTIEARQKLRESVIYADDKNKYNTLYKAKTMFASKFGEFWFKHQNLFEIEYLSRFDGAHPRPPPVRHTRESTETGRDLGMSVAIEVPTGKKPPLRYEDFNPSSVKAPIWTPLTSNKVAAMNKNVAKILLCRLKKYKHPIFNQKVYDVLDLPLYDEYFFLYFGTVPFFDAIDPKQDMANLGKEYIKLD